MPGQRNRRGASRSVFLNCPFDEQYRPLFRSIVYAVLACGFKPRCALESMDSSEYRLDKIARLIGDCDWGIHDISRVEVQSPDNLPRFNMPLELGIHLGARLLGEPVHRRKRALILESETHRYDRTLSDISGQDIAYHHSDPRRAISCVRAFFNDNRSASRPPLPGDTALLSDYETIAGGIGDQIAASARLGDWASLSYRDFVDVVTSSLAVLESRRTSL